MKEEFKGPKNKWSQIFRKKWFFPALYLSIAAVLLAAVVWYQNAGSDVADQSDQNAEDYLPVMNDEDAVPVVDQQELVGMPVENADEAEIVTKFFDYNAEQEDRENALVLYNNRYYQSTGVDIAAANAETFDVLASISGTVEEVKEDPLLGNVVVLSHGKDLKTYYASLGEVAVTVGDKVAQGDALGTAGNNLFGKDNGTHVHFEIRKDGKEVNPESYFEQPVSSISVEETAEQDEAVSEEPTSAEEDAVEPEEGAEDAEDTEEPKETEQEEVPSEDEATDEEIDTESNGSEE
ncbi:M23 family metallopeptidase [Oceanobacillus sp. J11TS1]|uniref:M23 family metallopeptidase n=1 Tax=Oceanobacillus sp. J11TS1 TaxID=2807191 RepID=UPI001AFD173A|nr:M23 family metallopeptidase [Oceanobacillus sp. J11TS1]GIO25247.1 stage II sporulation protein Q [Oceanobacillus sp. J11TS1]